jgi:hypothetical protein
MKNMEFKYEDILKENLWGQIWSMNGKTSTNLRELIDENTRVFD